MIRSNIYTVVDTDSAFVDMVAHLETQRIVAIDSETNGVAALLAWDELDAYEKELVYLTDRYERWKHVHRVRYKNRKSAWTYNRRELAMEDIKAAREAMKPIRRVAENNEGGLEWWNNSVGMVQIGTDWMTNDGVATAYLIRPDVLNLEWFAEFLRTRDGIIFHNAKFDIKEFVYHFGVRHDWLNLIDTQAAEYVITLGSNAKIGLKNCLKKYCKVDTDKSTRFENWHGDWSEQMKEYAAIDVWYLFDIMRAQDKKLDKDENRKRCLELEELLIPVLVEMEIVGIGINVELAQVAARDALKERDDLVRKMRDLLPGLDNPLSTQQLKDAFKLHGVHITRTDDKALEAVDHPAAEVMRELRKKQTEYTRYYGPLVENHRMTEHGPRVYPSFNSIRAASGEDKSAPHTGRLSCSNPNLQNQPVKSQIQINDTTSVPLRAIYIPRPDFVFISADLDQIEPRITAHITGDEALNEAFRTGLDPYLLMAARKGKGDIDDLMAKFREAKKLVKDVRDPEKIGLLSVMYGKTAYGLAQDNGWEQTTARKFLAKFFKDHPGIDRSIKITIRQAYRDGYVTTLGGRVRLLPGLKDPNKWVREHYERAAFNTKIQGTAADGMKWSLIYISREIKRRGLENDIMLLLTVHDEVLLEARNDAGIIAQAIELTEWAMQKGTGDLIPTVPVTCAAKVISNWGEGKD